MATYFLRVKHISRGKGARATRAAAYRAGERIHDERTGEVYDHAARRDVAYKDVVLPSDLAGRPDMAWTQDRAILWNAMEHAGTRRNSRMAREWLVFLPPELTPEQRVRLIGVFAKTLADKYRCAVDLAIHRPRPGADPRHHHAHLLMTTREVSPDGVGARTTLELSGTERHLRGLGPTKDEYLSLRERWAEMTNNALREAGLAVRVDHRSYKQRGINREPVPTIPEKVFYAERKQGHSAAGDAIRARHRERVEARLKGEPELARVVERQKGQLRERARESFRLQHEQPERIRWGALTRAERNELRRERYKARRALERLDPAAEARRREIARQRYRENRQRDSGAENERPQQRKETHANKIDRKQREYGERHAEELNHKRREYRLDTAGQSAMKSPQSTAEESAKKWKALRESQGPGITSEDSARLWKALREQEKLGETSRASTTLDNARGADSAGKQLDESAGRSRGRDLDLGL